MFRLALTVFAFLFSGSFGSYTARGEFVAWNNLGAPTSTSTRGNNISEWATADDFELLETTQLTDFVFWGVGINGDSSLQTAIGWAVYSDVGGTVGTLVHSGTDTSTTRESTGVFSALTGNPEILRVNGSFGSPLFLTAGTYWISFRDGPWGSTFDGTTAAWVSEFAGTDVLMDVRQAPNEATPSFTNTSNSQQYFQLIGSTVPEPSSPIFLSTITLVGLLRRKR